MFFNLICAALCHIWYYTCGIVQRMTDHVCKKCGEKLMSDEIALHRKLFSRAAKEFMCLDCQAAYLRIDRGYLENVIEKYHKSGTCVLFAKYE